MLTRRILEMSLVATFAACLTAMIFVSSPSEQPCPETNKQRPKDRTQETNKGQQNESLWHWITHDAAGFFTLLLVIVGGCQVVLFWVQLKYIRESLGDAKIAANAAKDGANAALLNARASIALQLPIIRIEPGTLIHGDSINGEARTYFCIVPFLTFFNLGSTKAFPKEIRYGWTIGDEALPVDPRYLCAGTFAPNLIFEPDPKLKHREYLDFQIPLAPGGWSLICGGKLPLWFYCNFGYADFMGTHHDAGFCWQNVGLGMDWRVDDTPAYNRKT